MIQLDYACPNCQSHCHCKLESELPDVFACPGCGCQLQVPAKSLEGDRVLRCLVCPSTELYVRKDFSQRLGVAIVVFGLGASCLAWYFRHFYLTYGILFATALIDAGLYLVRGSLLQCYRCQAEYRGMADLSGSQPFSLETHEKYRQQAARMTDVRSATTNSQST